MCISTYPITTEVCYCGASIQDIEAYWACQINRTNDYEQCTTDFNDCLDAIAETFYCGYPTSPECAGNCDCCISPGQGLSCLDEMNRDEITCEEGSDECRNKAQAALENCTDEACS